eukprot:scaffold121228_cov36-Phaeocystis_antarctica.AAC.1
MFAVRSTPCPAPNLSSVPPLHAACPAVARHLPPPGPLPLAPHRMPSFRISAVRVGVQSAAELRHLQRHKHAGHVLRALLPASPAPNLQPSPLPHAACTAVAHRLLPPRPLPLTPHRMPSFRLSTEYKGVQPAAELRHLQRHNHAIHVLGALLPVPCPQPA